MRISLSEFREMIEEHSQEMRQAQEDYNLMADEKDEEIKRLDTIISDTADILRDFKFKVLDILSDIEGLPEIKEKLEKINEAYHDLLDGLDSF